MRKLIKTLLTKTGLSGRSISLPGFQKIPIYDVLTFYKNGIANGTIGVRASAISFNFFMAIFPSIIFIFSLIPFIPVHNFQNELISLMQQILPSDTYLAIEETIVDITMKKRGSLLSIGLFAALFFSTNGVASIIASLNASTNATENRSWLSTRLTGVILAFTLFFFISVATSLIIFNRDIIEFLVDKGLIQSGFSHTLVVIGKWTIVLIMSLLSISTVYYLAPAKRTQYRFFSPGSIMATILMIVATLLFSLYVSHFGRYNAFFGSIGTLIALLIWFNINSFVLLMGFELNVSIRSAGENLDKKLQLSENALEYNKYYAHIEEQLFNH